MSRQVECPYCNKKKRLFSLFGRNNKANIEIKCKQCGRILKVLIDGDDVQVQGIETA